ncbi:predicted protein [Nematostella vectensis]|uniref:SAM-dependent MTase RsmB/NOP-type domain-containing protein n=1 Tax=Nematostella vectensis TaxID=45351 RepID=A7SXC0_NEMVE|nr:predicted protein [Nematostella vectensis]|eukprot:XP_001623751.1 predicted protein [Nematostella vectensis]
MLFDYQQNGFFFGNEQKQKEVNEEDILPDIAEIQAALASHRTKLRAALARCRIRDCAISVEALLPMEEQEKIKYAAAQPVYARVNTLKSSLEDVMARLQKDGYVLEEKSPDSEDQLTGKNFISDEHFDNLLVFSAEAKFDLHGNDLTNEGCLVIQDKSTVISVEVVRSFVNEVSSQKEKANILIPGADMKKMLGDGDDIIQTHVESGNITAYLSSVIHPDRTVFTFGATPDTKGHLQNKMEKLGARNVTFLEEHFLDAIPNDERFRKVKIIVVNVPCSKTGIVNPVDFVLQEGVSASIKELARGGLDNSKIRGLAFQHLGVLKHAMSFPLLQGIVYITRSIHTWENIDVVKKAMEEIREAGGKLDSYYDLAPALPNLAKQLEAIGVRRKGEDISLTSQEPGHNYLKLEPSAAMNGGFVALLTRKKPVESPADVLERAAKKGLMKPKGGKTPRAQSPKSKRVPSAQSKRPPVPKQELEKLTITDTTEPVVSDTELDSAVKGKPASKKKTRPHGSADSVPVKTPSKTKAQKKAEKERAEKEHEEHMRQFKF